MEVANQQRALCAKYGVAFEPSPEHSTLGISKSFDATQNPINGLRHPPQGNTCGWYIWSGRELSQADDFFVPLHVHHLPEVCEAVLKFIGLPPGWRFLLAPGKEDVWFDLALLDV